MAFPTSATASAPVATPTAVTAPAATVTPTQAAVTKPAAFVAPTAAAKKAPAAQAQSTKKTDTGSLLNALKLKLAQNEKIREAGEPKDLPMSAILRIAPELHAALGSVLEHFGFGFGEESTGLRFIPEGTREDGSVKPAALYFISIAAAPEETGGCLLRWGNETKELDIDALIYPLGIRILGKQAVLATPTLTCPIGLLVKSDVSEEQEKQLALCGTFGELAPWLNQSAGGNILSDLPIGFLLYFTEAEDRTSKKGNVYTLLHGTQLDADSQPMGEVSIFSPGRDAAYWADKGNKVVLQYDDEAKLLNVLDAQSGAVVEALALTPKTLKLKELEVGATYDWMGCELVQFKTQKGWVIKLRKQGDSGSVQCYTNRTIENTISGGAGMILAAAGLPTDDLDQIFKVESAEPFGTIEIKGHKKYSSGISVDVEIKINKTESQAEAEDALFAELGLI